MGKLLKNILLAVVILAAVLLGGPFLVPVPPLESTRNPRDLADPDSEFIDLGYLILHYKLQGTGKPALVLLHGFGASTFSWREVMEPLGEKYLVAAYDRPAFGLTQRPLTWPEGQNPYSPDMQVEILVDFLDSLGVERAVLIGNSAGGTVALNTYLADPDRVEALILVNAAVYRGGGAPAAIRPLLSTPQLDHLGPLLARRISTSGPDFIQSAWADPGKITPEIMAGYQLPLQAQHWDIALWELTKTSRASDLPDQLGEITVPCLVIAGAEDQIVPPDLSRRLNTDLPDSTLALFENCGHLPQEECPELFLEAVIEFLIELSAR